MSLFIKKSDTETWREAVLRISRKYGLEREILESFDSQISSGFSDEEAAFYACYEWDTVDYEKS